MRNNPIESDGYEDILYQFLLLTFDQPYSDSLYKVREKLEEAQSDLNSFTSDGLCS